MIENTRFKVKTTNGYKKFAGIAESSHKSYIDILFTNGESVKCSGEHIFWLIDNTQVKAKDLFVGFNLVSNYGVFEVSEINEISDFSTMFDIIEVESYDNSFLLANSLKTHNCLFITYERTLIDTDVLDFYKTSDIITEVNDFKIYKDKLEHVDGLLIVTIDPSGNNKIDGNTSMSATATMSSMTIIWSGNTTDDFISIANNGFS